MLERSEELCPLAGQASLWRAEKKTVQQGVFCRSGRSRYIFTKTKVLKRKRQKIRISKHRIPICVARHKENVTDRSRTTVRRDSCSSGALPRNAKSFAVKNSGIVSVKNRALPRNAKSFASLRGKPPYGAPKRKQCKKVFLQIRQKSIQFYKDKSIEKKEAENPPFQTPYPYLRGAP